jgi:hypothetical protein
VWVIELENQGYAQSFGTPSADPYLARTLPRMGVLLAGYYGIGRSSAANYLAQVSAQAPSLATQADCPVWTPFPVFAAGRDRPHPRGDGPGPHSPARSFPRRNRRSPPPAAEMRIGSVSGIVSTIIDNQQ